MNILLLCSWLMLAWQPSTIEIYTHITGADKEDVAFANVEIKGPNYFVSSASDFDGYCNVYLQKARIGDTCYLKITAEGYQTLLDTVVITKDLMGMKHQLVKLEE